MTSVQSANVAASTEIHVRDPGVASALERDGYAVIPFFRVEELAAMRRLHEALPVENAKHAFAWTYLRDLDLPTPGLPAALCDAADRVFAGHRIIASIFLTKEAGGPTYPLHQHPPLTEHPFARCYTCWAPLEDAMADRGTLMVVPKSHRLYNFVRLSRENEYFAGYREQLTHELAIPLEVRAGEAVIFDNNIIHGSLANGVDMPRTANIAAIVPAGARHCAYRREPDGGIAVLFDGTDDYKMVIEPGVDVPEPGGEVVRRLPSWNRRATLDEMRTLIASGRRAAEGSDPLPEVCGDAPTGAAMLAAAASDRDQRLGASIRARIAPFVPGPVKAARRWLMRL